jgi:hypothetical protein
MKIRKFILGYRHDEDAISLFSNEESADFNSEEWVRIWGYSLEYAIANYEFAFIGWRNNEN